MENIDENKYEKRKPLSSQEKQPKQRLSVFLEAEFFEDPLKGP